MTIKLADFGLAKQSEGPSHTITGTPIWRAPEQGSEVYSDPVDMWAVGCVVFYLLTSLNPFFSLTGIHETRHQSDIRKYTFPFWPRLKQWEFTEANRQLGYRIVVPGASNSLNGFLSRLIIPDPPSRMSAHEALSHEWICPRAYPRAYPLDSAVGQRDMPLARLLSKYDNRFEYPWEESNLTAAQRYVILKMAAENGNYELVRETMDGILARSDSTSRAVGWKHMKSALVAAAAIGNIDILELLRVNLPFLERSDNLILEAFTVALKAGHHETVKHLWSHVSMRDRVWRSELNMDIACRGTTALLDNAIEDLKRHNKPGGGAREMLHPIKPGADGSAYEHWFENMIIRAAQYGNIDNFEFLLETPPSADRSVPETLLSNALVEASLEGHPNIVRFLLARGVFPSQSAVDAAVSKNRNEIFRSLSNALRRAHDKEPLRVDMWNKLSVIPYCGLALLKWLMKHNYAPEDLTSYLRLASYFKDQEVVNWFLATTDSALRKKFVSVAFVGASEGGHVEMVENMLDEGVHVSILDAWVGAAKGGHTEVLQLLLSKNPEPSENIRGRALRAAIRGDHLGAVMQLLYCSGLEAYVDNASKGHRIIDIPCNQVISDFLRDFGYHV